MTMKLPSSMTTLPQTTTTWSNTELSLRNERWRAALVTRGSTPVASWRFHRERRRVPLSHKRVEQAGRGERRVPCREERGSVDAEHRRHRQAPPRASTASPRAHTGSRDVPRPRSRAARARRGRGGGRKRHSRDSDGSNVVGSNTALPDDPAASLLAPPATPARHSLLDDTSVAQAERVRPSGEGV